MQACLPGGAESLLVWGLEGNFWYAACAWMQRSSPWVPVPCRGHAKPTLASRRRARWCKWLCG